MNKILVIDDDSAINELIKVNLELCGYKVVQACDGIKGFALCKQELPALVILDVMMPDVDGFTVAQRIRKNDDTKNIPILMLTALSQINDKVNGFNIGVDDYLVKPFEMEEFSLPQAPDFEGCSSGRKNLDSERIWKTVLRKYCLFQL